MIEKLCSCLNLVVFFVPCGSGFYRIMQSSFFLKMEKSTKSSNWNSMQERDIHCSVFSLHNNWIVVFESSTSFFYCWGFFWTAASLCTGFKTKYYTSLGSSWPKLLKFKVNLCDLGKFWVSNFFSTLSLATENGVSRADWWPAERVIRRCFTRCRSLRTHNRSF